MKTRKHGNEEHENDQEKEVRGTFTDFWKSYQAEVESRT